MKADMEFSCYRAGLVDPSVAKDSRMYLLFLFTESDPKDLLVVTIIQDRTENSTIQCQLNRRVWQNLDLHI
jgi:hypothetical protein